MAEILRNLNRAALVVLCFCSAIGSAQVGKVYTAADYEHAERLMDYNVNPLVYHTVDHPVWLADGRFWYRDVGPDGVTFMLVDPAKRTKAPAFSHVRLAAALDVAIGSGKNAALDASHLPIDDLLVEDHDDVVLLTIERRTMRCDLSGAGVCKSIGELTASGIAYDTSPDGKKAAFIRDHNLWVRYVCERPRVAADQGWHA